MREEANDNYKGLSEKIQNLYNIIKENGARDQIVREEIQVKKSQTNVEPKVSKESPLPKAKATTSSSSRASSQKSRSSFNSKTKVLYVADSVGHTASAKQLESYSKTRIVTAKAYSSVHDRTARWPEKNFTDVVKHNLENSGREDYDVLIMTAPTVDISNLDTSKVQPSDSTDVLQQSAVISAHNMFSLATRSLEMNQTLKKVIIIEHPPRFDSTENAPMSLKPPLANLVNFTIYG